MHAMPVMLGVLTSFAVAYRYYSAFLAAKVVALDDDRVTPPINSTTGRTLTRPIAGSSSATISRRSRAQGR
jgi:carbon starvation protein CstA